MHKLYTVGYADWTAPALKDLVDGLGALLMDVRLKAWSEREEWQYDQLVPLFDGWYQHCPALGNKNYNRAGGDVHLADMPGGMRALREQLEQYPVVIMCGCRTLGQCHRLFVADIAAERFGLTVEHLPSPGDLPPPPGQWKCLTLTQPWATLVMIGAKRIETRSWSTPYRGPLLIHAGKGFAHMTKGEFEDLCEEEPFASVLAAAGYHTPADLPLGMVLGSVDLMRCSEFNALNTAGLSQQEREFGDFAYGRFGLKLANPRPLVQPVPARGLQKLWNWLPDAPLVFADEVVYA